MRGQTVQDYLATSEVENEQNLVRRQVMAAGRKAGKSPRTISHEVKAALESLKERQVAEAPDQYLEPKDLVRRYRRARGAEVPALVDEARRIAAKEVAADLLDPKDLTEADDPLTELEDLLGFPPLIA